MRSGAVVLAVAGCGRIGFTSTSSADDAPGATDGIAADAFTPCTTWGPFGAPQKMPSVLQSASDDDWGPTPSADERELMFYSFRGGSSDIFVASRTALASSWSTPIPVDAITTPNAEAAPTLTG